MKKYLIQNTIAKRHFLFLGISLICALFLPLTSMAQSTHFPDFEIGINELPADSKVLLELHNEELNADQRLTQGFPSIWNEVIQTDKVHGYIINLAAIPRINEIPLEYGDWIGGFYLRNGERFCGGARMWTGIQNVTVTLYGDDGSTIIKDGFSGGELIEFRFFLQSTQKEYVVSIMSYHVQIGYVTNGCWYPTSISMVMNMKAVKAMDFYIQIADNPICINNQAAPSAEEFIGTGGPYTFSWSSDPPGYNHNVQTPPPIVLDVTTDFFLTVTDPNNVSEHQVTVLVYDHPTANAGENGEICANKTFTVSGESTNALNVEWTTNGDGAFANPNLATTVYTPGTVDKLNGSVLLTFSADPYSPCSVIDSDDLTLNILPLPTVIAGEDISACGNETVIVTATATNFDLAYWTTSGSGTFSSPNSLTTHYTPAGNDIILGVTLTICVTAINPCILTVCDQMQISYFPGPTVAAPSIIRRCEGITFTISGSVSNNSGVLWTTQGDGTFANPSVIPAIYTPGPQDIANFGTIVTLNSLPVASCDTAKKNATLFIQQLPSVVSFGPNTDYACKNYFLQLAAEAYEYTTVAWSRIGDGTFSSTNVLNPKYYPGTNDKLNGYFTLILSLAPKTYCSVGTTVQKTVQIIDNPTVEISTPSNQHVCAYAPFPVTAFASSYENVLWTSLGDGAFTNQNALTTQYNPGPGDVSSGANIKLTLLAVPVAPCDIAAEDFIFVSFKEPPYANAGNNATICENQTYQLNGTANAYFSISWQTSGSGSFSNPGILQPVYTPSAQDALNGSVNLTLTSQPNSPCVVAASDQMVLTIQRPSTANAGEDGTICHEEAFSLSGSVENAQTYQWTTGGDGTFGNANALITTYTPGESDIDAGSVLLTLSAQSISPCTVSVTDQIALQVNYCHDLTIESGWSGLSTFVNPLNPAMEDVFEDVVSDLIILQSLTGMYWPGQSINTIGNWTVEEGYSIKVANQINLTIAGSRSTNKTLQLNQGWNLIPVLSECDADVEALFAGKGVIVVKEVAGWQLYWPAFNINTLQNLQSGKAYYVLMVNAETITFPGCTKNGSSSGINSTSEQMMEMITSGPWNTFSRTAITHIIAIPDQIINTSLIKPGDYLGVFDQQGNCYGMIKWEGKNSNLTLFGDDPTTTEKDGFITSENLYFRMFIIATGKEYTLDVTWDQQWPQQNGNFAPNGISVIAGLTMGTTQVFEQGTLDVLIYPNPAGEKLFVDLVSKQEVVVTMTDIHGREVLNRTLFDLRNQLDISMLAKGVYLMKIEGKAFSRIEKVIKK